MTQTVTSQPMKRVEDWKSRLIDLSKRNNLLYFHRAKRGSLPISQPDMQSTFNALVLKKRRLEFWSPPEETEQPKKAKGKAKAKIAKANAKAAVKRTRARRTKATPHGKSTGQRKLNSCRPRTKPQKFAMALTSRLPRTRRSHFTCRFWHLKLGRLGNERKSSVAPDSCTFRVNKRFYTKTLRNRGAAS